MSDRALFVSRMQESALMKTTYGIIGCGGFGREVAPLVQLERSRDCTENGSRVVFVTEGQPSDPTVNGVPVISLDQFLNLGDNRRFTIAIADSHARERLANTCLVAGAESFSVTAPTVRDLGNNKIGEGAILCDFSMLTSNATIGKFVHLNIYSYIAHDCVVGDYVTFAPGVKCNGHVIIEDHAYIGTGVVIRHGSPKPIRIGKGAIVGMGAVITKDVEPYTLVVGNPAKIVRKLEQPVS
ncbi:transferase hexapeptide repeat protein [Afipia carboxidovorans OM5]|nr:acetyltransferase [Afipia carboxidovorans]ACI93697.1 transferase hexapeptide repeat protein [Afipia carboxidovorans OM5]